MAVLTASAYAPAAVGNVASGFDLIGHCIEGLGDVVTATRTQQKGSGAQAWVHAIQGRVTDLPTDPARNTASCGATALLHAAGADFDVHLSLNKGIPMAAGLGGSAASATAAVVATNALLSEPLERDALYPYAAIGEAITTGQLVGDNVGPQLLGGLVLATEQTLTPLPVPVGLTAVVVHPNLSIETTQARECLLAPFELEVITRQQASLAQLLIGLYTENNDAIAQGLVDHLIEPRRGHLIPGFAGFKELAKSHGALGASISGAGPSVFAWFGSKAEAQAAQHTLSQPFEAAGFETNTYLSAVAAPGARLVDPGDN